MKKSFLKRYLIFDKYFYLALFFLFLQFIVIAGSYNTDNFDIFYWFCNHTPLFFSIAFFIRNISLVKSLINVGFLIQFVWLIDFLIALLFSYYTLGITRYVFEDLSGLTIFIPILIHIFSTNVSLIFTFKEKTKDIVLIYSFIYLVLLYIFTLFFTSVENNINCIYEICSLEFLTPPFYTFFWIPIMFILIILPSYYLQKYLFYLYLRYKNNIKSKVDKNKK